MKNLKISDRANDDANMCRLHWDQPDGKWGGNGEPITVALAIAHIQDQKIRHPELLHYIMPVSCDFRVRTELEIK